MSTKGMIFPQEKPMLAGNPKDSAIAANNQSIAKQSDLIKATGGSRHKSKRNKYGGATGGVVVPQYQMQYAPTGAGGQDPNSIIKQNAGLSTQGDANAQYDNLAGVKKGGSRKKRGGYLNWGCYSGGRKKSRSRIHKRKTYKKRRTNRRK